MADDYGTVPNDVFTDERLYDASLATIAGYVLVMHQTDDYGHFEGHPRVFARAVGAMPEEVEQLFDELARRGMVEFYAAPGRGGVERRVGRVIGFYSYQGHPDRVAVEQKRGASRYPLEDGTYVPSRRQRGIDRGIDRGSERGTNVAPRGSERGNQRGKDAAGRGIDRGIDRGSERGTNVAPRGSERGNQRGSRARSAQHSTAQHRGDPEGSPSVHGDPALAAPLPALTAREAQHEEQGEATARYVEPFVVAPLPPPRPTPAELRSAERERTEQARREVEAMVASEARA